MQFVGIGFKKTDEPDFNLVRDQAASCDLLASRTLSEGHFRDGLKDFASRFDLSLVQLSSFNEDDKRASSDQISRELMDYHDHSTEIGFLDFLISEETTLPGNFHVLFACDWSEGDPIRLEKINRRDLKDYFKRNNSWYLWLYNYSAKSYYPKLNLPLILEIIND